MNRNSTGLCSHLRDPRKPCRKYPCQPFTVTPDHFLIFLLMTAAKSTARESEENLKISLFKGIFTWESKTLWDRSAFVFSWFTLRGILMCGKTRNHPRKESGWQGAHDHSAQFRNAVIKIAGFRSFLRNWLQPRKRTYHICIPLCSPRVPRSRTSYGRISTKICCKNIYNKQEQMSDGMMSSVYRLFLPLPKNWPRQPKNS